MHTSILAAALAFATGTFASGWGGWNAPAKQAACLNQTGVDYLVNGYTYLLEYPGGPDFNSTANAILSDEFFVLSDSINTLSEVPLGQLAYPSREVFILTQFLTPALPVVQTLETFYTCDKIGWRWNASGIGSNKYEIKGLIQFNVNATTVQIDAVYSEFNTAAFEADLGLS